jgi:hypothetical protein
MSIDKESKKITDSASYEVNHPLLPKITNDEVDLEIDTRRDDEIKQDKPPHHN